jgi:hypothetical protein
MQLKKIRQEGFVAWGKQRIPTKFWLEKAHGKRETRPRLRQEINIKINLMQIICGVLKWIEISPQGPMTDFCEYGN